MRRTDLRLMALSALCGLAASSAAVAAPAADESRATAKAVAPFAQCFTASQDRSGHAWWFVPKAHGGTFSNLGANGVAQPYFVDIADKGATREVRVMLASASADRSVVRAVDSCI